VPYLVPFIVRDYGFTEQQRALLLNSFTPGYVIGQIPCGWLIERFGTKIVVTGNCAGLVAVMLGLPIAARAGGARAVSACLVLFGLLQ
jgi:MFS family permease